MRKYIPASIVTGIVIYIGLYSYFWSIQDDRFKSVTLSQDHIFTFDGNFEELNFSTKDGGRINSLLFKADSSGSVICFWKGNGGNLAKWGLIAPQFLKHKYDFLITDYREHGKSRGAITMDNFYSDAQAVYDFLKTRYPESRIVLVGYSLGTAIASHLSRGNQPAQTVLIEPRVRFENKYQDALFFPLPGINRFPFRTDLDIQEAHTPLSIVTGTKSSIYKDAVELKKLLNENDRYFEIPGATHGSILGDAHLEKILNELLRN